MDLTSLGIAAAGGLVGFGILKAESIGLRRDMEKKADKDTVEAQYEGLQNLMRQSFEDLNKRLDRMEK